MTRYSHDLKNHNFRESELQRRNIKNKKSNRARAFGTRENCRSKKQERRSRESLWPRERHEIYSAKKAKKEKIWADIVPEPCRSRQCLVSVFLQSTKNQ